MDLKHQKYELNENMSEDELIRNLKSISESLQITSQDEETQEFAPLSLTLAEDYFLSHPSKDVQLLVACCIADIMRIYAPEAPYKDQYQIKTIFMFLINQLEGISNPRHKSFSRYFYLMEILAYTKSFTLCFELEDNQEVFIALFKLIFKICNINEPNAKVRGFMLDIMCPLVCEADNISNELLDVILKHIIEPDKIQNPNAYELCKQLITKTSEALSIYVKNFLCSALVQTYDTRAYESTASISRIYDVMYELYTIAPNSVKLVLPTLEGKLQSKEENYRMKALDMLIKIISEEFVIEFPLLWQQFKQRFADIAPSIRRKCVAASKMFLNDETKFKDEIIEQLSARKRDSDENVRFEVVNTVVDVTKKNWKLVVNTALFEILKERAMDTKFIVRKEALQGFSIIYKSFVTEAVQNDSNLAEDEKIMSTITTIKNKILHGYYMKTIEDKMLIERLFITCLVPYNLESKIRMKILYELLTDIDEHAMKAFIELQRQQTKLRMAVFEWIKCHKKIEPNKNEITTRAYAIATHLPEQNRAKESLVKFSGHMQKDNEVMQHIEAILSKELSCLKCTQKMQMLLKKMGIPSPTNTYYNTVKNLLNRIASVTVDGESIEDFLEIIETKTNGKELSPLTMLSQVFAPHFYNESALNRMLTLLKNDRNDVGYKENILKAFTNLTLHKSLSDTFPQISNDLMEMCKRIALDGAPKQCKQAVTFMCTNTQGKQHESSEFEVLKDIVNSLETSINISNAKCRTAIVAMSVISEIYGEYFKKEIAKIIGRNIVRGLLLNASFDQNELNNSNLNNGWIPKEQLPETIRCIIAACKSTVYWLIGLKCDLLSAQKTMKIFDALIITNGNIQEKVKVNKFESAWVKLTAAKSILKICEHKTLRKSILPQQFLNLSKVMLDESPELREIFIKRLYKGLNKGSNENSLPWEFLGLYVFGGIERDLHLIDLMRKNFNNVISIKSKLLKANDKDNGNSLSMDLNYLPIYGIALLTHSSILNEANDLLELRKIEKCLKFIIDPLIDSLESTNNISCIKQLIRKVKLSKNKIEPENEGINEKMWTIAEIASKIMKYSSPINKNVDSIYDVDLPDKYFEKQPNDFHNDKTYLSNEFLDNSFRTNFTMNESRKRSFSNSDDDCIQNGDVAKKQKSLAV